MLYIKNILLEEDIVSSFFCCDLPKCKGACCTFPGEFGAPLEEDEIYAVEASIDAARKYLPQRSKSFLEENGWFEGKPGDLTTKCIDKKDCVFVYWEGDIAKCALEKAYFKGETDFRKPLSCHLFPVRVSKGGDRRLYYMKIDECLPAQKKGYKDKIRMYEFLSEALERGYGRDFIEDLRRYAEEYYGKKSFSVKV